MKYTIISKQLIISSLIISVLFTAVIFYIINDSKHRQLNSIINNQVFYMQNNIDKALLGLYKLEAFIIGAKGKDVNLEIIGKYLIDPKYTFIRNILIAPGGVVSQIYPFKGSEAVIGLDLLSNTNKTNKEARYALENNKTFVFTGPYELVEGGMAISVRTQVGFKENGTEKNWGLISITFNFPEVMHNAFIDILQKNGYAYKISKLDPQTKKYVAVILSNCENEHVDEPVDFSVNGMDFRIEAHPIGGWHNYFYIIATAFGLFFSIIFLSEITKYLTNIRKQASIDSLTGATNRVHGEKLIKQIIKNKSYKNYAFILLDIDHFKNVNDTLGHKLGDEVLRVSAKIYKSIFSKNSVVYRLGGDEFVIFLLDKEDIQNLNLKLSNLLDSMRRSIINKDQKVAISCSIGVAFCPDDASSFEELYERADKALYESKSKGRDRFTYYKDIN